MTSRRAAALALIAAIVLAVPAMAGESRCADPVSPMNGAPAIASPVPCAQRPLEGIKVDEVASPADQTTDYSMDVLGNRPAMSVESETDEPIRFDSNQRPVFSASQRRAFDRDFQAGLMLYARTREGRAMIRKYGDDRHARIRITLEPRGLHDLGTTTPSLGNSVAPANGEPLGFAITINSSLSGLDAKGARPLGYTYPSRTPVLRALQIGAEMLHVDFFAEGHPVGTHHGDPRFQARWLALARELGCPGFPHHD